MPSIGLLLKPASGLCDLRCQYCFYRDVTEKREQASYGIMSHETLRVVLEKSLQAAKGPSSRLMLAFQGGEPTLAGLDFFRETVRLLQVLNEDRIPVDLALQTNGMSIDEQWAAFFAQNRFLIGLSLDGNGEIHDHNRPDAAGNGTFKRVMRTAELLNKYQVEFNILTVITKQIARKIQSVYQFYRKHGFVWQQYIPCLDPLGEVTGKYAWSLTPEIYGKFLCDLFDHWYRDAAEGRYVSIRQFDNYLQILLGQPPEQCGMGGVCGAQNVVEADGSVYPCDFYVLDAYRLGNLLTDSFAQIDACRDNLKFLERSTLQEKCRKCSWLAMCRGGCRRHREPDLGENYFCLSYRMFFQHAFPRLRQVAEWIHQGRLRVR